MGLRALAKFPRAECPDESFACDVSTPHAQKTVPETSGPQSCAPNIYEPSIKCPVLRYSRSRRAQCTSATAIKNI